MELVESVMWFALGFGPTIVVLVGLSEVGILRIKKHDRKAKIEVALPGKMKRAEE